MTYDQDSETTRAGRTGDTGMDEQALDERLARLEERLARLEARPEPDAAPPAPLPLPGLHPSAPPPPPPPPVQPPLTWQSFDDRGFPLGPGAAPAEVAPPPLPAPASKADVFAGLARARREPSHGGAAPPSVLPYRSAGGATLEAQVGVKWVGWAGAILVVIGAALLIKYAYDRDWFGALPPAARLALMSLGGFALLAAGEAVYRRVGAVASAGLFGAGVATLFVVSFAGYKYFGLYERNVSFLLMAVVTLIGAAVAIRGNLVSIAALSIIGGNVAPVVLSSGSKELVPLFAYLLMLQVVALVLAWWGPGPKWWALRGLAMATICIWVGVPLVMPGEFPGDPRGPVLTFSLIYATLFHAEIVLSSLRPVPRRTLATGFAVPVPLGAPDPLVEQRGLGVTFGLLVTAALTVAVLVVFQDESRFVRGAWAVGIGACCLALGLLLPKLARQPDHHGGGVVAAKIYSSAGELAVGYRIQAAALLVVAVPVALSDVWVTVAWAVLAAAFAVAGAAFNLSVSRAAGVIVWVLAVAHLGLWTFGAAFGGGATGPLAIWFVLLGEPIPAYLVLAALLALVGHAIAALTREDWTRTAVAHHPASATPSDPPAAGPDAPPDDEGTHSLNYESRTAVRPVPLAAPQFQAMAAFMEGMSACVFVVAAAAALPPLGLTLALLGYGWAMLGAERIARSPVLLPAGLLLLAAAGGKWLAYDTLVRWLDTGFAGDPAYRPAYNPAVAVGAALVATAAALVLVPMRGAGVGATWRARVRAAAGFAAVLIVLWGVTMEIDRHFELNRFFVLLGVRGPAAAEEARGKHVPISIFWSVYAVACVALGFRLRVAGLRYFGLALFAVTALKVMFVDLSQVQTGYRILSFLGLGLLLLGTSVLYAKLSPVLLGDARERADELGVGAESRA